MVGGWPTPDPCRFTPGTDPVPDPCRFTPETDPVPDPCRFTPGTDPVPDPCRFTPGTDPVPIVQKAGCAPGLLWTGAENLAPHRDSIPGPSNP